MTRTLYDSTTVEDIPKTATLVAGYVDGAYRTVPALHRRFPKATIVTITVTGQTPGANVCDTEPGNVGVEGAAAWAAREVAAGRIPTLYCMASQWAQVKDAVAKRGLTGKVNYWIAHYDGQPLLPAGAVAKQYADPNTHGKGHFDLSVVADHWPGVDPAPEPTPLSRLSTVLARQLTARLAKRAHPLSKGRQVLHALKTQIERIEGL